MKPSDIERCQVAISTLALAFGTEMSPARFEAYWLGIGDLELADVVRAVETAVRSPGRFMPTPGELREMAGAERPEHLAVRAWLAVRAAIRSHGAWVTVDFDDPAINAAVRAVGGWASVCSATVEELDRFRGREFQGAYVGFLRAGVRPVEGAPLPGLHATEGLGIGYDSPTQRVVTGLPPAQLLEGAPPPLHRPLVDGEPVAIGELLGMGET